MFSVAVTYFTGNTYASANVDTTFTITPAAGAVPYRINVGDMRASSYMNIGAKCLDPANAAGPWIQCNLTNTASFPRTNNPIGTGTYGFLPDVYDNWPSNGWITVGTPGPINWNQQSNGLYIDLPPTVREITIISGNQLRNNGEFTYATVFVADAPRVSKSFAPAAVKPGEQSTLTISLAGPGFGKSIDAIDGGIGGGWAGLAGVPGAVPGVQLTDVLPTPLTLVSASTTCTGGTLTAAAGSNTLALKDAAIPNDGCIITAVVQWPGTPQGIHACNKTLTNTITPPSQFSTLAGQLSTPANADLACTYTPPPKPPEAQAPTAGPPWKSQPYCSHPPACWAWACGPAADANNIAPPRPDMCPHDAGLISGVGRSHEAIATVAIVPAT